MRVAIVGGGIAGLAAAYELELAGRAGADVSYELFEAGSRLGGVIASSVVDGSVIERGPDSFLTEKPAALQLCRELGLDKDFVASDDAHRKTYIVVRNRLVELPDGLMFLVPTKIWPMVATRLFGWWTKIRMGIELLLSPRARGADESVAALVRRHYGQEAVDRLADPLLSGIYGGDAAELSAQAVLPRLVDMEAKYGSLTLGMLAGLAARKAEAEESDVKPEPKPIFTTLRLGLQELVDALVGQLDPQRLHVGQAVSRVDRFIDGWSVTTAGSEMKNLANPQCFDAVIVATPAWAAAEMLGAVDRQLCDELGRIPYSSSVTVNLVYDGEEMDPLPPGFGFLVPAVEGRAMLACTFIHRKFPGRTAPGKSVLRVFLGGARRPGLLNETDEALSALVQRELFELLEISAVPELVKVQRWPRAMAQYAVGHKERVERIHARLAALPGLQLVGNAFDGIGISDCIRLGRVAAKGLVALRASAR